MTREEFINNLEKNLNRLNKSEKQDALQYYKEYLDEIPDDSIDQEINKLGSPQAVAEQIISESGEKSSGIKSKKSLAALILTIIILVISSPVWISLLAAYFSIVITIIFLIFSIYICFPISTIGMLCLIYPFSEYGFIYVLFCIGTSLFSAGIAILLFNPALKLIKSLAMMFFKSIKYITSILFN